MIGEIDFYGVFLPPLLVLATLAVPLAALARALLSITGAYRLVWHRPLFDLSLFILIIAGLRPVLTAMLRP